MPTKLPSNDTLLNDSEARGLCDRLCSQAIELSHALIVALDGDGRVRAVNRETELLTGWSCADLRGKPFAETIIEADEDNTFAHAWAEVTRPGESGALAAQCLLRETNGALRHVAMHMQRVCTEPELVLLVGRDVTDEQALAAQLRQSEKLAAVGTLAAGLAHEIRNPLNSALLHLTFLKRALAKGRASRDVLEALDVVNVEINRLSCLATDFLSFARPRALERTNVALQELCSEPVEKLSDRAKEAGVAIELLVPEQELMAQVDATQIEQVVTCLLSNSIEAIADQDRGTVTLKLYRRHLNAVIEVVDDGPGLQNPDAPIFDAFYTTKPQGTGLGLAIVHRIVSSHEGRIEVSSRAGKTAFRVQLPLLDPRRPSQPSQPGSPDSGEGSV